LIEAFGSRWKAQQKHTDFHCGSTIMELHRLKMLIIWEFVTVFCRMQQYKAFLELVHCVLEQHFLWVLKNIGFCRVW